MFSVAVGRMGTNEPPCTFGDYFWEELCSTPHRSCSTGRGVSMLGLQRNGMCWAITVPKGKSAENQVGDGALAEKK